MSELDEKTLELIFFYGSYALQDFIKTIYGIDIIEVFPKISEKEPMLISARTGKNLALRKQKVPNNNTLDSNDVLDQTFLLNCANDVFKTIQLGMNDINGALIFENVYFKLDDQFNMILMHKNSDTPVSDYCLAVVECKIDINQD